MENDTQQIIDEQLKSLPLNFQKAILTFPWKEEVREIANKKDLSQSQTDSLETETMFVLYGLEPSEDYVGNLIQEVGLMEETAIKIAEEASLNIFEPILSKAEQLEQESENSNQIIPEPNHLPMVEPGEVAHDTTPEERAFMNSPQPAIYNQPIAPKEVPKPEVVMEAISKFPPQPNPVITAYPEGKDPYREPLE